MNTLTHLFKLAEITRDQPQYGYNLAGLSKHELSDLAQHHYLVTFIAWQLALRAQIAGGRINVQRVMEISMIHDLGELFGGDICHYYAKANPRARELAKAYEQENNNFLHPFFQPQLDYKHLITEMNAVETDEAKIAKVADYLEVLFYKHRIQKLTAYDTEGFLQGIIQRAQSIQDSAAKGAVLEVLQEIPQALSEPNNLDIFAKHSS